MLGGTRSGGEWSDLYARGRMKCSLLVVSSERYRIEGGGVTMSRVLTSEVVAGKFRADILTCVVLVGG